MDTLKPTQFWTNMVGVMHTTNMFLPRLRTGSAKKIILLSTGIVATDVTLSTAFTANAPYYVSKAALNLAVAKYVSELRPEDSTFLAISHDQPRTGERR